MPPPYGGICQQQYPHPFQHQRRDATVTNIANTANKHIAPNPDGVRPVDEERRGEDARVGPGGGVQDPQQTRRQGWPPAQVRQTRPGPV